MCLAARPEVIARMQARAAPETIELYLFRHAFEGQPLHAVIAAQLGFDVRVPVHTDDISLLRFLANSGRGVAVVPEMGVADDLSSGRLRSVPLVDSPRVDVYATFSTKGARRPLIDAFLA